MRTGTNNRRFAVAILIAITLIASVALMQAKELYAASMSDYCAMPPYVKKDAQPNILVLFDNSSSMKGAAYDNNNDTILDSCSSRNAQGTCTAWQDTYNPSETYEGYFDSGLYYKYANNVFTPERLAGNGGIYGGNLLNWATTSKMDLLMRIMVDGKSTSEVGIPKYLWNETGSWQGTFSHCVFKVSSNNLVIEDETASSCALLDGNRLAADTHSYPNLASLGIDKRNFNFAKQVREVDEKGNAVVMNNINAGHKPAKNFFVKMADKLVEFFAGIMDLIVPDAEAAALRISTAASPTGGTVCVPYGPDVYAASGGSGGYTWSITNGSLPAGLFICQGTANCVVGGITYAPGNIYGTPTASGTFNYRVTVTDSSGSTDTVPALNKSAYSLVISPTTPLSISTATIPNATENAAYSATLSYNGGCGAKTWTVISDTNGLFTAGGLIISSSGSPFYTGQITATSVTMSPGTYPFTVKVEDPTGFATKDLNLTVLAPSGSIRRSQGMTLKVCRSYGSGDFYHPPPGVTGIADGYELNCDNSGQPPKTGILQLFANQARIGLEDFNKSTGAPEIPSGTCISPNQASNFFTQVENVQIYAGGTTNLVNGLYNGNVPSGTCSASNNFGAIDEFACDTTNNCNPFRDATSCMKNAVLMITDGKGAAESGNVLDDTTNCTSSDGVHYDLSKNSCYAQHNDLRNATTFGADNLSGSQVLSTYIVNTMGNYMCPSPPSSPIALCSTILAEAANVGDGIYYGVTDPTTLRDQLMQAFRDIIKRAASGTAASVLASGEGSGANLIQAVFYPRRKFYDSTTGANVEINWIGRLTNLWYYVDPFFATSSIREDDGDKILTTLTDGSHHDYIVRLYFKPTTEMTMATRWQDPAGNGVTGAQLTPDIEFEKLGNLWEAGYELWKRNISTDPRAIYTTLLSGGTQVGTTGLMKFSSSVAANVSAMLPYLDLAATDSDFDGWADGDYNHSGGAPDSTDAGILINWANGIDYNPPGLPGLRTRTVTVATCSVSGTLCSGAGLSECPSGETCTSSASNVWKLGDVLDSTPKISSWLPLNQYNKIPTYGEITYGEPGKDPSLSDPANSAYFITKDSSTSGMDGAVVPAYNGYRKRGMVFAGANDGMLHAFRLGTLELNWSGQGTYDKARMINPDTGNVCQASDANPCGKEMWAFVPKNALPYIKYAADPTYCHVYSVDLTPYVFDASISKPSGCSATDYWDCDKTADSWRTIVIGGMRFGGACKPKDVNCSTNTPDSVCAPTTDAGGASIGYSSYFALDVTDQNNPKLLWEFSDPNLGFTTTGPAIVRINARDASGSTSTANQSKNGRWFVVFGSGPTGPINTTYQQFEAHSDQPLGVFVFDLKDGPGTNNANVTTFTMDGTGDNPNIPNAFAGSMLNSTHDADLDYQDDALYIPYVRQCTLTDVAALDPCTVDTWTNGGVLRLITKEDLNGSDTSGGGSSCAANSTALNPHCWAVTSVIDGIGAVTSSVAKLQNNDSSPPALWLYFGAGRYYYAEGSVIDDADNQRYLFGIKDPCFLSSQALDPACSNSDALSFGNLDAVDLTTDLGVANPANGWYISLDPSSSPTTSFTNCNGVGTKTCPAGQYGYCEQTNNGIEIVCRDYKAERVITDPLATTTGIVYFTTYKPYADECTLGGKSFLWAAKYDTGGAGGTLLKGKAIVQVSTGSIEQIDLSSAFTEKGGRRTGAMEGVPPTAQGLSLLSAPPPVKRVIHIRER